MADIGVVAEAISLEMRRAAPPAASPEEALLNGYRKSFTPENHPLHFVAGEAPPNRDQIHGLVDANIGTIYDAAGNKVWPGGTPEATRHDAGNAIADILSDLQEGRNINALAANATVVGMVESIIIQNPTFAAQYNALGPAAQTAYIEGLLSDKTTRGEVARLVKERGGVNKLIQDDVIKLKKERDTLDNQRQEFEKQIATLDAEIKAQKASYEATKSTMVGGAYQEGRLVTELKTLRAEAEPVRQEVNVLTKEIEALTTLINDRETAKARYVSIPGVDINDPRAQAKIDQMDKDLTSLKKEKEAKRKELQAVQKTLAEKDAQIKAVEANEKLNEAVQRLEQSRKELTEKLADVNGKLATNDSERKKQLAARLTKETEFLAGLTNIIPEAVAKTMNEWSDKLIKEQIAIEKKAVDDAKSAMERNIRNSMLNAYRDAQGRINWDQMRNAWNLFLQQGIDGVLIGSPPAVPPILPVGPPPITIDELRGNKELYDAITKDLKDKMRKLRVVMPRGTGPVARLEGFLRGPKPISRQEAIDIIDKLGEGYLQEMVKTNKDVQGAISAIAGEGMLNARGRISDRLRGLPPGLLLLLLPFILGGGFLFGRGRQ